MLRRTGIAVAAAGLLCLLAGSAAGSASSTNVGGDHRSESARSSGKSFEPRWVRYHQEDFSVPAGEGCSFRVDVKVIRDREFYKTVSYFSNGNPRLQLFKGPLVLRYTNASTKRHITRDVSGRAIEEFEADGTFASITIQTGHFSTTLPKGSQPGPGLYRVGGTWSALSINAKDRRVVTRGPDGTVSNLCIPLAMPAKQ